MYYISYSDLIKSIQHLRKSIWLSNFVARKADTEMVDRFNEYSKFAN
jgi:hypothetical protein